MRPRTLDYSWLDIVVALAVCGLTIPVLLWVVDAILQWAGTT